LRQAFGASAQELSTALQPSVGRPAMTDVLCHFGSKVAKMAI